MNKTHKKIIENLSERNELRLKKLYTGIQLLCISLITIISGPILIQIGFVKSKGLVNLYSILGVLVCVLAIVLIYTGIKKIGDYIFIKNGWSHSSFFKLLNNLSHKNKIILTSDFGNFDYHKIFLSNFSYLDFNKSVDNINQKKNIHYLHNLSLIHI